MASSSEYSVAVSSSSGSSGMGSGSGGPQDNNILMFAPFASLVSPTFWGKFDEVKVEVLRLNEDPVPFFGFYSAQDVPNVGPILSVDNTSFDSDSKPYYGAIKVAGILKTTISPEHFKGQNYNELMKTFGQRFLGDLFTPEGRGRIARDPRVLAPFFLLLYADLKRYKFLFWFGFPAISLPSFEAQLSRNSNPNPSPAAEIFKEQYSELTKELQHSKIVSSKGFYILVKNDKGKVEVKSLEEGLDKSVILNKDSCWFGFLDTSSVHKTPSWVLRNYLAFIKLNWNLEGGSEINIFSYRPGRSSTSENDKSCVYRILLKSTGNDATPDTLQTARFIGWERNDKGSFGPKHLNAQSQLDPMKLVENAVDFNLRLMKWRLFPEFDLKLMHHTKCLVIGAGTLGCNVARCLMGWGVRDITFVDNGSVSYSNPVRQSLYDFEDCSNGGKPKAEGAAEHCKKIFPGMRTKGERLMIPMPGHPISAGTVQEVKRDYDKLIKLVQECDVMYLLMDTRESRWLPTVLGVQHDKLVINAALGFDSYLVMRHGMKKEPGSNKTTLGCYYCTDVVAPGDSTRDRTLDQQCTVTRPGVSMIAAALAVELMVAILHHPKKGLATASIRGEDDPSSPLGFVPHSIRGFIGSGEQISPSFQAYDKCTGCSEKVLSELETRGFDFVADVLNSSSDYLEKLTGLDLLKNMEDLEAEILELSDDDDGASS